MRTIATDSIRTKQAPLEHVGVNKNSTEYNLSANEAFEDTPTAEEHRQRKKKKQTKELTDSTQKDSVKGSMPMQWANQPADSITPKQKVDALKQLFATDSLSGTNMQKFKLGVAGDPIPYSLASDNLITGLLVGCFILVLWSLSNAKKFLIKQSKNIFLAGFSKDSSTNETAGELNFQLLMGLQTCLLLALIYFLYINAFGAKTFVLEQYQMIGLYTGIMVLYFLSKALITQGVNKVFFDKKQNRKWIQAFLFTTALQGLTLFPIVLLRSYFNLSTHSTFIYTAIVIICFKLLALYNAYLIFFKQRGHFLQLFLYFCSVEITPFAALWGIIQMTSNYLQINI